MKPIDPITVEIIQSSLQAICDEMFATMRKTAMSSIIYEVLDFGVGLTDAKGNLASSGAGIPAFIGMVDWGVRAVLAKYPNQGQILPGDVFATNRPHFGGVSHSNDVTLMLPVFADGELIAWMANKAHWNDVGGMSPGSINPNATEIFQEGLQIPEIKLLERGEPIQPVIDMLTANVRQPESMIGDFWAGVSSMRSGERRLLDLVRKYGREAVVHSIAQYIDYGETVTLQALAKLPKGVFTAEDRFDDGRLITVSVEISDNAFIVDLRGNPAQTMSPLNASYAASVVNAQVLLKAVTSPETPANAGSFRPLQVLCDPRSVCNAEFPAPMGIYYDVIMSYMDLIWKALAPVIPDRLTAGTYGSTCGTLLGGIHPETGKPHSFIEPEIGGWGACRDADGQNAQYTGMHGDTLTCPVEINEARNGIMVDQLALNPESGGEGALRGGKGIYLDYRILADNWWLTAQYSRSVYGPWSLEGGAEGSRNYIRVIRKDGQEEVHSSVAGLILNKDDVVRIVTANGGGYGDPLDRPRAQLAEDVRNGYVSEEQARSVYGALREELAR